MKMVRITTYMTFVLLLYNYQKEMGRKRKGKKEKEENSERLCGHSGG
jgi:hypothetical protein